jgi:perosamine synthetase
MQEVSWWRTTFGEPEIRRLTDAINHEHISQGEVTAEFEREVEQILGVPYVVATTSGSMAILMALLAAGVGPGDEVIVPNRTWIATAHAALLLGARPVLVDVVKDAPVMDVAALESKITGRTKAIIPVHLNGRSVNMRALNDIAARHGIKVVEDAAQALCSRNVDGLLGTQSFAGCFSLSVAKIIATGQGGFVVTRDEETYHRLKGMRTHGVSDVINCTYTRPGFNFRFTDIQASIGLAQLERLPDRIAHVKAVYEKYAAALPSLSYLRFLPVDVSGGAIPIYIEVLCPERERLIRFLAERQIQVRPFYPDLHRAPYLASPDRFPNSEIFGQQGIFLPSGPSQSLENVERVLTVLGEFR